MFKRLAGVTFVLCAVLAQSAQAGVHHPSAVKPHSLGVNAQFLTLGGGSTSPNPVTPSAIAAWVTRMADAGVQTVRLPVRWAAIEQNGVLPGTHLPPNWGSTDAVIQALAEEGIRVAALLVGTPGWARLNIGNEKRPPNSDADFAAFAAKFAARYRAGGIHWTTNAAGAADLPIDTYEIYNEPNLASQFQHPINFVCNAALAPAQQPGPQRYASLFAAAYWAIHGQDPQAIVMLGGLADRVEQQDPDCSVQGFIQAMRLHTGVVPDAIGLHVYRGETAGPENVVEKLFPTWAEVLYRLRRYRKQIDDLGWSARPIYLNETGWVTWDSEYTPPLNWPTTPEAVRGMNLAQLASKVLRSNCGVRQFHPHTWRTTEGVQTSFEHWFGLTELDGNGVGQLRDFQWSNMMLKLRGDVAASAPATGFVDLCDWRDAPDVDGDGDVESADTTPIETPDPIPG